MMMLDLRVGAYSRKSASRRPKKNQIKALKVMRSTCALSLALVLLCAATLALPDGEATDDAAEVLSPALLRMVHDAHAKMGGSGLRAALGGAAADGGDAVGQPNAADHPDRAWFTPLPSQGDLGESASVASEQPVQVGGGVTLKAGSEVTLRAGGKFCSASGQFTTCNKDEAGLWEIFTVVDVRGGEMGLKALGQYCMNAESKARVRCSREHTTADQRMRIINVGGDKIALSVGGKYCSARSTGIDCSSSRLAEGGKFSVSCLQNCKGWITATTTSDQAAASSAVSGQSGEVAALKKELAQAKAGLRKAEAAKGQHNPKVASLEAKMTEMKKKEASLRSQLAKKQSPQQVAKKLGKTCKLPEAVTQHNKIWSKYMTGTPYSNHTNKNEVCVGWDDRNGARCGLSLNKQKEIAQALQCPALDGKELIGITRVGPSSQVLKSTTIHALNGIFGTFSRFAHLMGMSELTMPSDRCCGNFKSGTSGWTDKAVAQCCAKMPNPADNGSCLCGGNLKASGVKKLSDINPPGLSGGFNNIFKGTRLEKMKDPIQRNRVYANTIWRNGAAFAADHAAYDPTDPAYTDQKVEEKTCLPLWPATIMRGGKVGSNTKFEWACAKTKTGSTEFTKTKFKTKYGLRQSPICEKSADGSTIGKRCLPRDPPWPLEPKAWAAVSKEIKAVEDCNAGSKAGRCKVVTNWQYEEGTELGAAAKTDAQDTAGAQDATESLNTMESLSAEEMKDLHSPEFKNALGAALQMMGGDSSLMELKFEDSTNLGERATAKFGGRRRRRFFKAIAKVAKVVHRHVKKAAKVVHRHVKKAAKVVHKHVKKAAKFVVKHVKKGLKAVGKWISGAAMAIFKKALNLILKLIPQPWRNIVKKGLPKLFKGDFVGFLLIHEVKQLMAKITTGFVPKSWKPFIPAIIMQGLPKILGKGKIMDIMLIPETGKLLAVIIEGFVPNKVPMIGFKKRKILERVLVKGSRQLVPKVNLHGFVLVPEVRVVAFIASKLLSLKLNSGAAAADNWAKAMYRWVPMLLNSKAYGDDSGTSSGPVQVVHELVDRFKTLFVEPLLTARFKINMMWFECSLRSYMMPLFSKDYTVHFLPINYAVEDLRIGGGGKKMYGVAEGSKAAVNMCKGEDCNGAWATDPRGVRSSSVQKTRKWRRPGTLGPKLTYKPVTLGSMCDSNKKVFGAGNEKRAKSCEEVAGFKDGKPDKEDTMCRKNRETGMGIRGGKGLGDGHGPQKILVVRQLKTGKWIKNRGYETLDVCHFSFSFEAFKCGSSSSFCGAAGSRPRPWAQNLKIMDSATYDPDAQVPGHGCRKWFVMAQRLINSIIMAQLTVHLIGKAASGGMKKCKGYDDPGYFGPGYDTPDTGCKKKAAAKVQKQKQEAQHKERQTKERQTKATQKKERQAKEAQTKERQTKATQKKERQAKETKQKHRHHRHHRPHRPHRPHRHRNIFSVRRRRRRGRRRRRRL